MTVVQCDICGEELPAELVKEATATAISPQQAMMCEVCRFFHGHRTPDGHCLECGDSADDGYQIKIEWPCGVADIPARTSGSLCGDCAAHHAFHIISRGVQSDDEAQERYTELIDRKDERRRELEASA